ncbi:hypothetical protein BBJ28_00020164 [Nothophytophthora sp. Chile5]|nr:hypothetical protein BBJ28_00020164 [Nothophytophthora sp. Chile5]
MPTPKKYNWVRLSSDSSEIEIEMLLDRQKMWTKKTSQHEACQVCAVRFSEHTMHYAIYKCNAPSCADRADPCTWHLRTTLCDITKRGTIDQDGHHVSSVVEKRGKKLNLQMKWFVREKVVEKLKPSRILNAMIDARLFDVETEAGDMFCPVTRYAYNYRTNGLSDNNDVGEAEAILANRQFHPDLPETAAFAFGFPTNESGNPHLTRGTASRPLVIGFSSKAMLRSLERAQDSILHVDATFKLNTAGFPSIIIGVPDTRRQFHSVAFFIVSDIRQAQLVIVFREMFKLYHVVTGSLVKIKYVMADADVAQRNALQAVVRDDLEQAVQHVYLMCFFHVTQNVRKYITSISPALHHKVHRHVYRIHYARSDAELDKRVLEAVEEWKSNPALRDFERRFSQQWLCGRFTRWQCFVTPPGFAKTNNPVEQFNKELKRDYSLRSLLSVNALAQAFLDMAHHRSCRAKPFEASTVPSSDQARRFRQLEKQGRLSVSSHYRASIAFLMEGNERQIVRVFQSGVDATNPARKKPLTTKEELDRADQDVETAHQPSQGWLVNVDESSCPCRNMFKLGYCVHLIAARVFQELPVVGVQMKRTFEIKGKKAGKGRSAQVGHALALE